METVSLKLSKVHLLLLTVDELKAFGYSHLIPYSLRLKEKEEKSTPKPLCLELTRINYVLPPTLVAILGEYWELLDFNTEPLEVPTSLSDKRLLEYMLFDLPVFLSQERSPVLLRDICERFSEHVEEGVAYLLNIMRRISRMYNTTVVVADSSLEVDSPDISLKILVGKVDTGKEVRKIAQIVPTGEIFYL